MTLIIVSVAWLAGVGTAALDFAWTWPLLLAAGAGSAIGLTLAERHREAFAASVLVALALLGLLRYETLRPPETPGGVALFNDGDGVQLRGIIVDGPELRERSQRFTLRVDAYALDGDWQLTQGAVLVTARLFPRYRYGDVLELRGRLETPPRFDDFDYREYLARRGVTSLSLFPEVTQVGAGEGNALERAADSLRRPLVEALGRSLPEPEAALAQGILLGERASIPRDLTDDLNTAGISHLVAISGYNVMLVAGLCLASLSWLIGRRAAAVASMVIVLAFALLVGASPSVLRAAFMALPMLGAVLAGRPASALTAVTLVAALQTAWDPLVLYDVAFQLSFMATLGIILLAPRLQELVAPALARVLPEGLAGFVAESASVTSAASLFVLPVIALTFGRVSLITLPANLVAGFAFPFILATSFVTAVAGALSEEAGRLAGEVAYPPLRYLVLVGRGGAAVPGAALDLGRPGVIEAALLCGAVAAIAVVLIRRRRADLTDDAPRALRIRPAHGAAALLVIATLFLWMGALDSGNAERLTVTVLDVGQGDAILIETPAGHRILVDGGPSGAKLSQALGRELPAGARRFDLVVLTHGQDDHVTGLVSLLDRYDIGAVLMSPLPGTTAAYHAWVDGLAASSIPVHEAVAGEIVDLGSGVQLEVLGPPSSLLSGTDDDLNNNSVVLRLVYGEVSFLLTGDIEAEAEAALLQQGGALRSTVLKAGHHGSDGSSTPPFLAAVQPAVAVISTGAENPYGHPSPTTRLRFAGVPLLRTDLNGSVRFETDGRRLWAGVERGGVELVSPTVVDAR